MATHLPTSAIEAGELLSGPQLRVWLCLHDLTEKHRSETSWRKLSTSIRMHTKHVQQLARALDRLGWIEINYKIRSKAGDVFAIALLRRLSVVRGSYSRINRDVD